MHIDWWTLGLQTVNALVLVWLLKRFLFSPVAAIIEARRKAAADMLDQAAAAKAGMRDELARQAAENAAARDGQLAAAAAEAEALKARLTAEAQRDADVARSEIKAENARLQGEGLKALSGQANALALDIAARLLDRLPETARIDGFIDGLARAIADLSAESRTALANEGAPLTLLSACALTPEQQTRCTAAIGKVIGRTPQMAFAVDAGLIAGLEIRSPYLEVRNSFRADLERIASELGSHGAE